MRKHSPLLFALSLSALLLISVLLLLSRPPQMVMAQLSPVDAVIYGKTDAGIMQPFVQAFSSQTGFTISYEYRDNLSEELRGCKAAGICPDAALVPNIGIVKDLVSEGALQPLESILTDYDTYFSPTFRTLDSVEGVLYAVTYGVANKSVVWYSPPIFTSLSQTVPPTWTAMMNTADNFVSNGLPPFALGTSSGAASGWTLSDLFENILLQTSGPDTHRMLARHQIAWNDPRVVDAMTRMADILSVDAYQAGGISGTLNTFFGDAFNQVYITPTQAAMFPGGSFMLFYLPGGLTPETDYNVFSFPAINFPENRPVLGGADTAILFSDTDAAKAFIQFMASPQAGELVVTGGTGGISPNHSVDLSSYANPTQRSAAEKVLGASDFLYDLDDQLPSTLQQYIWQAMLDFAADTNQMQAILQGIEDQAVQDQGPAHYVFLPSVINQH